MRPPAANIDRRDVDILDAECVQIRIIPSSKPEGRMSEIFGKIFGKDKHAGHHKDKLHGSGDKISSVPSSKWGDFCEYRELVSFLT